jgi:2-oxo-4-hydroxy-4-carboxy--5-ureidoimidazoline (OHCU) decarboxylase
MISIEEALEGNSPLARKVGAAGPFGSVTDLISAMRRLAFTLSDVEKVATLNAHPRIGEKRSRMSARSASEQGDERVAGLDELNAEYEHKFGFRFVTFVNRRPRSEVAEELRSRLGHTREQEMVSGISAIIDIAEDRLLHA